MIAFINVRLILALHYYFKSFIIRVLELVDRPNLKLGDGFRVRSNRALDI